MRRSESLRSHPGRSETAGIGVGTLCVVPTPIGDPDDISLRALHVLQQADLIAAEHPHVTLSLLAYHGITASDLARYGGRAEHNQTILTRLASGQMVALVCDAGAPTVADPGGTLIRAALNQGARVVALPGPVAVVVALIASGLSARRFVFDGFPPRDRTDRDAFFARLAGEKRAIVLYEAASYLRATLDALRINLGPEREIAIARDLTRPTEMVWRGRLGEARRPARGGWPRGQYTLVIAEVERASATAVQ